MNGTGGSKVEVIAEVGSVHDGSFGNALCLVDLATECGADTVKFQTHIASAETLRDALQPPYFNAEPRYDYFERTAFRPDQWCAIIERCENRNILFLSSPFSCEAVDLLETAGAQRFKIPSGEVTHLPLLEKTARTGKPVLLSSGMSSWEELDEAVNTILRHNSQLTILQCTSAYPCPYEQVGLDVMLQMRDRYQLPVGLSDHTLTPYASFAAVSLGAAVIEKHLTFSRRMYGSDARHSMEPHDFRLLVEGIRAIETMLAVQVNKHNTEPFEGMKLVFEKSMVSLTDIPEGAAITRDMIGFKKPGTGIPARRLADVLSSRAARFIPMDTILSEDDLLPRGN